MAAGRARAGVDLADRSAPLGERIRRMLAAGRTDALVVEGSPSIAALEEVLDAGQAAGYPVRVPSTALSQPEMPPMRTRLGLTIRLAVKRLTDVVLASVLLFLLSPLMLAVAVVIRVRCGAPVFYAWRVAGRRGRFFTGYKFRTMVRDADRLKRDLSDRNEMVGPVFKLAADPRLTPIGRWLRRFSIDELPQLWSVVKGDMSLVGPRPPLREEFADFELWQMRKLSMTPGITCLWQVRGRNAIRDFAEWARLDLQYIDHWSLRLDTVILFETVLAVLRGSGR
jgi:lipopolysaccharide/colanic/teichoic acid biosynthesis glycosyltransferase